MQYRHTFPISRLRLPRFTPPAARCLPRRHRLKECFLCLAWEGDIATGEQMSTAGSSQQAQRRKLPLSQLGIMYQVPQSNAKPSHHVQHPFKVHYHLLLSRLVVPLLLPHTVHHRHRAGRRQFNPPNPQHGRPSTSIRSLPPCTLPPQPRYLTSHRSNALSRRRKRDS